MSDDCKLQSTEKLRENVTAISEIKASSENTNEFFVNAVTEMKANPKSNKKNQSDPKISQRCKKENKPKNKTRYDGKSHFPEYDTNTYASRCKNEDCDFKTNVICSKCGVHLCFVRGRNCFKDFHVLELSE